MSSVCRIGELAERIGRSASTVRRWEAEGRLVAKRTASGQRYFNEDDIRAALNVDLPQAVRHRVVYCRVSSLGQKGDLASAPMFSCRLYGLRRYEKTLGNELGGKG